MIEVQTDEPEISEAEYKAILEQEQIEQEIWHEFETRVQRHDFVAFLDLMGYSQIAETDDPTTIIKVMELIKHTKDEARKRLCDKDCQDNGQPSAIFAGAIYDDIKVTFISDSIIIHRDRPDELFFNNWPKAPELSWAWDLNWFLDFIREVYTALLREKLPCRGGVAFGKYFWDQETILAGSALIEAHRASESIHVPAVLLCHSIEKPLTENIEMIANGCPILETISRNVEIERKKDGKTFRASIVRPNIEWTTIGDVAKFTNEQFTSYGKKIDGDDACLKLQKSIGFFTDLASRANR